ncbi:hypothetical protein ES703_73834 [subsurface metagenome]
MLVRPLTNTAKPVAEGVGIAEKVDFVAVIRDIVAVFGLDPEVVV